MRYLGLLIITMALCSTSCRTDKPPQLSIVCVLDGFGGGDCALPDGTKIYKSPSDLKNFWATSQVDESNFASWCYKAPIAAVNAKMDKIRIQVGASEEVTQSSKAGGFDANPSMAQP